MPKRKFKKPPLKNSYFNFSPLTFFIIGILLICFSLYWSYYEKTVLSFENFDPPKIVYTQIVKPQKLIIPSKSIDLEINEAAIINNNWQINPKGVSHLNSSANPGQLGNMIIYGHNKKKLLGNILTLKKGDQIKIVDNQGKNYHYQVFKTVTVKPSDVWVLNSSDEEILTLYTCSGLFDSKRFVVIAKPKPSI